MRAQDSTFDIAVVGAGVTGLAAAVGFARAGLRVALIGPAGAPAAASALQAAAPLDQRIYALAPASIDLLARLKVWTQVDARRLAPVTRMRVFGDRGAELSFDAYAAAVERLATIVEESELLRVLALGCALAPGLARFDASLHTLALPAAAAELGLDDGRRLRAALVVAADGAQSAVRAAAGIEARVTPYPHTAVVANFRCAQPQPGVAWQWFCEEGVVALLPLPGDAVSLVWSAPHALAAELLALAPEALAARVAQRAAGAVGALEALGPARGFPLKRLTADRLVLPRVALVGDAAHVVHPLAGQGLNLALQGVSTLIDAVSARESGRDPGDLTVLRRYARARAEPIGLIRFTTDALARLFSIDAPLLRGARNAGMAWVDRSGALKRALIRQALG